MTTAVTPAVVEASADIQCAGDPSPYEKEKATTQAIRTAVSNISVDFIQDKGRQKAFQSMVAGMKREELARFIIRCDRVAEEMRAGYYKIIISAQVDRKAMEDAAASLSTVDVAMQSVRILIVVPEVHIQRRVPDPAGETELIKVFLDHGFQVVDQLVAAEIRYGDPVRRAIELNDYGPAIAFAQKHGADVLVLGEAFSHEVPANRNVLGNMSSCRARIEVRVVDCTTANIYEADSAEAGAADLSSLVAGKKAIQKAAEELGNRVAATIIRRRPK